MSNISQIVEDGVAYDIEAKALDSTLDATILKKSNLVNGFTQDTAGVNALDAAAGKTLNDDKANKVQPTLYFKNGTQDGNPQTTYPHVELRNIGNASSGRGLALVRYTSESSSTNSVLMDKDGVFLPAIIERYGGFCTFSFNLPANGSIVLNVSNSARFMVVGTAPNTRVMFACLCATNGNGSSTVVQDLYLGSDITHTSAQSKLTFANSNANHSPKCLCIMFNDTPVVSV